MSQVKIVDDSNFETEVSNHPGMVLVDFGAPWCGPCTRQHPIIEQFAADNIGKIKVVMIDIDEAPLTVAKLSVRSVPSLLLFDNGKEINRKVGLTTTAELGILFAGSTKTG
jgi:thioredoxin 1